jgi:5-methylcytosine-specific restriction protein A
MEIHHIVPVHELKPGARTQLDHLALLCPNCHRMIHTNSPWLTVDELRERIN